MTSPEARTDPVSISKPMPENSEPFAAISWEAGETPVSRLFDDPYFAREDGRNETRHCHLYGTRPSEHIVLSIFAFTEQPFIIIQPLIRFEHLRSDIVVYLP